jgi:Holliday junction resolvasome RuvABC DNA-binding subunit
MSINNDTIIGIYSEIVVCFCLYGFRVYMLSVINVFETDFELKTRLINNNTQIELIGFDKNTSKQLFRVILEASEKSNLN